MTDMKHTDMEEINIATDVLVLGGGLTGIRKTLNWGFRKDRNL